MQRNNDLAALSIPSISLAPPPLIRFHSFAVGIAIPIGLPVLIVIGGWMFMEGRKEEVGDEEDEVQGIDDEQG